MYVSGVTCLSILLCLVTIVSRCEEEKASRGSTQTRSRPSNAEQEQEAEEEEQEEAEEEQRERLSASGAAREEGGQQPRPASTPVAEAEEEEVSLGSSRQTQPQAFQILNPKPSDVAIECKALRSKRYITDGFCTSVKPIEDMVCTGNCLPIGDLPWYAEFIKVWSRAKTLQYRCVDDVVRYKKVAFMCDSGETRSYRIRVVRSCKCKKYLRNQNESPANYQQGRTDNSKKHRQRKLSNQSDGRK